MLSRLRAADLPFGEGAAMQHVRNLIDLWHFVRRDRVGKWLAISCGVVAWFALTWMSLSVFCLFAGLSGALLIVHRKRRDLIVDDDIDDLL
jgi:hypothetical protein